MTIDGYAALMESIDLPRLHVRTRLLHGETYRGVEFSTEGDNGNGYADLLHAAANYVEDRGVHGCVVVGLNFTINPDTDRLQLELVVGS